MYDYLSTIEREKNQEHEEVFGKVPTEDETNEPINEPKSEVDDLSTEKKDL
jgi:hypothetical protein